MILVFGITDAGCDDGSTGGTDPALNGTWVSTTLVDGTEFIGFELQIKNGNYEVKYNGLLEEKGSANNGIVMATHLYGSSMFLEKDNLESRWYSKYELQTILNEALFEVTFKQYTYSVAGNTLTWGSAVYTRK